MSTRFDSSAFDARLASLTNCQASVWELLAPAQWQQDAQKLKPVDHLRAVFASLIPVSNDLTADERQDWRADADAAFAATFDDDSLRHAMQCVSNMVESQGPGELKDRGDSLHTTYELLWNRRWPTEQSAVEAQFKDAAQGLGAANLLRLRRCCANGLQVALLDSAIAQQLRNAKINPSLKNDEALQAQQTYEDAIRLLDATSMAIGSRVDTAVARTIDRIGKERFDRAVSAMDMDEQMRIETALDPFESPLNRHARIVSDLALRVLDRLRPNPQFP